MHYWSCWNDSHSQYSGWPCNSGWLQEGGTTNWPDSSQVSTLPAAAGVHQATDSNCCCSYCCCCLYCCCCCCSTRGRWSAPPGLNHSVWCGGPHCCPQFPQVDPAAEVEAPHCSFVVPSLQLAPHPGGWHQTSGCPGFPGAPPRLGDQDVCPLNLCWHPGVMMPLGVARYFHRPNGRDPNPCLPMLVYLHLQKKSQYFLNSKYENSEKE